LIRYLLRYNIAVIVLVYMYVCINAILCTRQWQ